VTDEKLNNNNKETKKMTTDKFIQLDETISIFKKTVIINKINMLKKLLAIEVNKRRLIK